MKIWPSSANIRATSSARFGSGPVAPSSQSGFQCFLAVAPSQRGGALNCVVKMASSGSNSDFPEWVVPMAATLTQERFAGPEWLFERKLDGIRMLACKKAADVKLYSRNRLPQHYPSVTK